MRKRDTLLHKFAKLSLESGHIFPSRICVPSRSIIMAFAIISQGQALLQAYPSGKYIHAWLSCTATPITILDL